jgi:hypothetical protein
MDRVDESFDIGLRYERGRAGAECFAAMNFVCIAGVENARYLGADF